MKNEASNKQLQFSKDILSQFELIFFFQVYILVSLLYFILYREFSGFQTLDFPAVFASISFAISALAIAGVLPILIQLRCRNIAIFYPIFFLALLFLPIILNNLFAEKYTQVFLHFVYSIVAITGFFICLKRVSYSQIMQSGIAGLVLCFLFFIAIVDKGYISPTSLEQAIWSSVHKDSLFHASLVNMIDSYEVTSLGVDGLLPFNYHALNHKLVAAFMGWTEVPALFALHATYLIIYFPLFLFLFAYLILNFTTSGFHPFNTINGICFLCCWPLAFMLFANDSYLASETFVLSMLLTFISLVLIFFILNNGQSLAYTSVAMITLMVCIWLTSEAKISSGLILAGGAGLSFILSRSLKLRDICVSASIAGLCFVPPFVLAFFSSLGTDATNSVFGPFDLLFTYGVQTMGFIIIIVFTAFFAWQKLLTSCSEWKKIVVLLAMSFAGLIIALLLKVPTGAALYFLAPSMWFCFIVLLASLPKPNWPLKLPPRKTFVILLLIPIAISTVNVDRWSEFRVPLFVKTLSQQKSENNTLYSEYKKIREIAKTEKNNFVVVFGKDYQKFWSANSDCWAQSFWGAGVLGVPSMNGLPPRETGCQIIDGYGLNYYSEDSRAKKFEKVSFCKKSLKLGFQKIYFSHEDGGSFVNCRAGINSKN